MRLALTSCGLLLNSCATNPPPIVDMAGKDPAQVNRDMAECHAHPLDHVQFIGPDIMKDRGFPESRCLESMGYTVLSRTQ